MFQELSLFNWNLNSDQTKLTLLKPAYYQLFRLTQMPLTPHINSNSFTNIS
jgi:hypothetical protein